MPTDPNTDTEARDGTRASAPAAETGHVTARAVVKSAAAWNGSPLGNYLSGDVELTVLRVSVPPEASSDWHTNPTPVAVYVLSGEMWIEEQGNPERRLIREGEGFAEIRTNVNRHGTGGPNGAELVVFFAGVTGSSIMGPAV